MTLTAKPKRCNFSTQTKYAREWRQWMSENDPKYKAKKAAAMREHRLKNPEKTKEMARLSYRKNAEARKKHQQEKWHKDVNLSREKLIDYSDKNNDRVMFQSIKNRCDKENIHFDIDLNYLKSIWPSNNICPVFGIEMKRNRRGQSRDTSPSLDRIIPEKGYVAGNVVIVSFKANRMKNNGTVEELKKLLHFYENQTNFL